MAGDGERATPALIADLAAGRAPGEIPAWCAEWMGGACSRRPAATARSTRCRPCTCTAGSTSSATSGAAARCRSRPSAAACSSASTARISTWRGGAIACASPSSWRTRSRSSRRDAHIRHFEFVDSTFNAPPRHAHGGVRGDRAAQAPRAPRHDQLHSRHRAPELLAAMRQRGLQVARHHRRERERSGAREAAEGLRRRAAAGGGANVEPRGNGRALDLPDRRTWRDAGDTRGDAALRGRAPGSRATRCISRWGFACIPARRCTHRGG